MGDRAVIYELTTDELRPDRWPELVADLDHDLYWHGDFDPDFYRAQARAGCIAITLEHGDRVFLTPELQKAYAVLDWENLHAPKSLARFLRSEKFEAMKPRLVVNPDPRPVLDALDGRWGEYSWLRPPYRELMLKLAADPRDGFVLHGVELRVGDGNELAAGELGYSTGAVYTSLTGFFKRDRKEWSGLGTVQLHLLARRLRDAGYAFWNLGHPYMRYKLALGARVLPRADFLSRWVPAVALPYPGLA